MRGWVNNDIILIFGWNIPLRAAPNTQTYFRISGIKWLKVTLPIAHQEHFLTKAWQSVLLLKLTTGDGRQVGYVILTVWNSAELFADRYKQLLFLVMESN